MDKVFKTFRAEVKGVNVETGEVDLFIPVSTMSVDRDGEIVEPLAFKKTLPKFMKRPVLVASHDYKVLTNQIGEWTKLKIGETGMDGKPKYYIGEGNDQADWGFKLASKGMAAFSIGFIPTKWEDGDGVKSPRRTYQEVELLEISQVIVPSNREAIQSIRSKGVDPITNKLLDDVLNDKEIISSSTIEIKLDNNTPLITKPEETDEFIRIPVDSANHEGHRIRTIEISAKEGISALYCGTDKVIMTYLFAKSKGWDMEKAKAWVKEHEGKSISELTEHKTTQGEIRDELDYLDTMITSVGLSKETAFDAVDVAIRTMARAWPYHKWESITLGETHTGEKEAVIFKRITGSDIPDKDKVKTDTPPIAADVNQTLTTQDIQDAIRRLSKGGEGSGNFGHEGRPGEAGGSGGGGASGGDKPSSSPEHSALQGRMRDSIKAKPGAIINEEYDKPNKYAMHYSYPSEQSGWEDKRIHGYAAIKDAKVVGKDISIKPTGTGLRTPQTLRQWLSNTGIDKREGF